MSNQFKSIVRRRSSSLARLSCALLLIYLVYCFILLSSEDSPLYKVVPVENYQLTESNSFQTMPFYKKKERHIEKNDVTLIAQLSVDRVSRLKDMAEAWQGPISAAVYVKNVDEDLEILDKLFWTSDAVKDFVDLHVLVANQTRYPVNNLRNLALKGVHTSFVIILDADFIPSDRMHDYLRNVAHRNDPETRDKTKRAFVIPAFSSDIRINHLPRTKPELLRAVSSKAVLPVNQLPCPKCHGPTDYEKWYSTKESYEAKYRWIYEPYLMLHKDSLTETFDERLKGYGFDKNTFVFTLAAAGYYFMVLPDAFVIHVNHEVAEWDGGSIQDQMWEALKVVCPLLLESKKKYGHSVKRPLFDEPLGDKDCFSRDHW